MSDVTFFLLAALGSAAFGISSFRTGFRYPHGVHLHRAKHPFLFAMIAIVSGMMMVTCLIAAAQAYLKIG